MSSDRSLRGAVFPVKFPEFVAQSSGSCGTDMYVFTPSVRDLALCWCDGEVKLEGRCDAEVALSAVKSEGAVARKCSPSKFCIFCQPYELTRHEIITVTF